MPGDIIYRNNAKSWMNSGLSEEYVKNINAKFRNKNRTIDLIVDTCPAHPQVPRLSNIELVYSPPNTTSVLQPMDSGIKSF